MEEAIQTDRLLLKVLLVKIRMAAHSHHLLRLILSKDLEQVDREFDSKSNFL
jgi:hypothetical protein